MNLYFVFCPMINYKENWEKKDNNSCQIEELFNCKEAIGSSFKKKYFEFDILRFL